MEMWVAQSPAEALNWAQALKKSDLKIEALGAMVGSWAQSDPKEAVDWVNQLPEGNEKTVLLGKVAPPVCGMVQEEKVKVGQEAPLFTTKTVEGKELKLADYRGKFVLLDFWATWCGPCLGETPNLKAVFEKYGKRQDFALIGLSLDGDPAKPAAYAKENKCGWVDGFLGDWGKDEVTKLYVGNVIGVWSRKDPVSASRFALEMPEGPQKIRAMEQVGQAWGGKNRGEAMAWAEKIKADADRKAAVGGVVQSWAMQDPAAALQFAEGQSDAKLKEQYVGKVIYGWCFKDRPGAGLVWGRRPTSRRCSRSMGSGRILP